MEDYMEENYLSILKGCIETSLALDSRIKMLEQEGYLIKKLGEKNLSKIEAIMEITGKDEKQLDEELTKWMGENNEQINFNFDVVYAELLNSITGEPTLGEQEPTTEPACECTTGCECNTSEPKPE